MGTKGFITVATGSDKYYKVAENLLKSYRLFSKDPLPFAILADRENEYTKAFDKVLLIQEPKHSFLDKVYLLNNIPFDETIFVESDCLAYADLNPYFDVMSSGGNSDFTVFGTNYSLTHQFSKNEWGWFDPKQLGKYESKVSFIPRFGSTLIYMKKGRYCSDMFNICVDVMNRPTEYGFSAEVLDDQIFAVGMAVMDINVLMEDGNGIAAFTHFISKTNGSLSRKCI